MYMHVTATYSKQAGTQPGIICARQRLQVGVRQRHENERAVEKGCTCRAPTMAPQGGPQEVLTHRPIA